jgi:ArsR family transcriptional regulator
MKNDILRTIGNISRVRILACLGKSDKTVTELLSNCCLSQSALSQHLMYLKNAKLISSEKKGRYQIYKIADKRLSKICEQILVLLPDLNKCN